MSTTEDHNKMKEEKRKLKSSDEILRERNRKVLDKIGPEIREMLKKAKSGTMSKKAKKDEEDQEPCDEKWFMRQQLNPFFVTFYNKAAKGADIKLHRQNNSSWRFPRSKYDYGEY